MPKLVFQEPLDERTEQEIEWKGYCAISRVVFPDGREYPVTFYDLARLDQDFEYESESGQGYIAEKGMIIVKKVNLKEMNNVVQELAETGYFDSFIPIKK